mmetsp:Transcript_26757/g.61655  ORF Transcript_26757/g.61655 Transcript_26757/m.61655 type:complete len:237 (+) Transcript_26757:1063-1773(+)
MGGDGKERTTAATRRSMTPLTPVSTSTSSGYATAPVSSSFSWSHADSSSSLWVLSSEQRNVETATVTTSPSPVSAAAETEETARGGKVASSGCFFSRNPSAILPAPSSSSAAAEAPAARANGDRSRLGRTPTRGRLVDALSSGASSPSGPSGAGEEEREEGGVPGKPIATPAAVVDIDDPSPSSLPWSCCSPSRLRIAAHTKHRRHGSHRGNAAIDSMPKGTITIVTSSILAMIAW